MTSSISPRGPGRIERWRNDRLMRTVLYALAVLLFASIAFTEDGWFRYLAVVVAVLEGISLVSNVSLWRSHGRHVKPVSTVPPPLSPDQRERVATLLQLDQRVAAVKLVRQETGAGLLAAVRAVDGIADADIAAPG